MIVDRAREQMSRQRRPPITGSPSSVEAILNEDIIRFCGENVVMFSSLERLQPRVSDYDPTKVTRLRIFNKFTVYYGIHFCNGTASMSVNSGFSVIVQKTQSPATCLQSPQQGSHRPPCFIPKHAVSASGALWVTVSRHVQASYSFYSSPMFKAN
ncbi:unnamed protein product [Angiostrongylus costaricensis]|uniref:GRAM domain-containing protein n=1 Tax=Angiostrongylus costaricensis TaxID=334426 RepID=A0A0R3PPP1_ANGCS|nr:unnamed protein product [Angiostrongylus costaricensis]